MTITAQTLKQGVDEAIQLAIEIADSTAMSDIESFCASEEHSGKHFGRWYDTRTGDGDFEREAVARAVKYLDLLGRIEHHPERAELVRKVAA